MTILKKTKEKIKQMIQNVIENFQSVKQTNEKGKFKMKVTQQITPARPLPSAAYGLPIIEMVKVEPGKCHKTFKNSSQEVIEATPPVEIQIQHPFWIATTMVTESQWKAIMNELPKKNAANGNCFPVVYVSWNKAQEFVEQLNARVVGNYEFSLPSEEEWEYAAQGGHKNLGTTNYAGSNNADEVAWFWNNKTNSGNKLHEVAKKKPNELGVYDMCGNAWEWCTNEYKVAYKVARGGDFGRPETVCTIALPKVSTAGKFLPNSAKNCYGLRLILKTDDPDAIPYEKIMFELSK